MINITEVRTVNYLKDYNTGKFRFITKCRAGWMTISDARQADCQYYFNHPEALLTAYKKGALQTIEFCPDDGDTYLTVFAKVGTKIRIIDETILKNLTVGTINQYWTNTNLYNQNQYSAVGAKTWADLAFVQK
jgi:hypothetical protein